MEEHEIKLRAETMELAARINRYDAAAQLASLTAVWDDASVNVGVVVPWTRGGDKCSDRFGVRVARFQLLLGIDCATDFVCGYGYVMRGNDAYNGGAGDRLGQTRSRSGDHSVILGYRH